MARSKTKPEYVDSEALPQRKGEGFSSKREGRLLPTERKYVPGTHKIVTAEEAQSNMVKRMNGKMAPIEGGSDNPMEFEDDIPDEVAKELRIVSVELPDGEAYDPLGEVNIDPQPGDAELAAEEAALAKTAERSRTVTPVPKSQPERSIVPVREPEPQEITIASPILEFLSGRERIAMELSDGSMQMTVTAVLPSRYGITILLPSDADGVTFVPKPGSEITITKADQSWECYFLGITFDIPELKLFGMVFVRNTEDT